MTAGLSVPAASVSSNALLLPTWRLLVVTFSAGWDDDVTPPCELGDAASTFEVCALVGWACFLDRLLCDLLCNDPLECAAWSSSCCVLSALARVVILERTCCMKTKQNDDETRGVRPSPQNRCDRFHTNTMSVANSEVPWIIIEDAMKSCPDHRIETFPKTSQWLYEWRIRIHETIVRSIIILQRTIFNVALPILVNHKPRWLQRIATRILMNVVEAKMQSSQLTSLNGPAQNHQKTLVRTYLPLQKIPVQTICFRADNNNTIISTKTLPMMMMIIITALDQTLLNINRQTGSIHIGKHKEA